MTGRPRAGPEPWAGREAHGHSAAPGPSSAHVALARPHACSLAPRPLTWPSPTRPRTLARSPLSAHVALAPHLATIQPWLIG